MDMIVRLAGEIDCATGPAIEADLLRAMSENKADVVADLSDVTFLDCAGLGALVAVRVWAAQHGLRFRVTRPVPAVRRLLDAVGPGTLELLASGDGESTGAASTDEGFSPDPQPGTLSGVDDAGHRLEIASEELRVADEEIRTQQELIDRLVRSRAADRLAVVRLGAALPVPLVSTDWHGIVRDANPAAAALLRVDTERLRGKPLAVLVEPSDRRALRSAVSRAPATGYPEHLSVTLTPRRGEPVPVDVVIIGEPDEDRPDRADRDESDAVPPIRFVIAPQGTSWATADAPLLTALGSAARLSTVDTDLKTALSRLAELAAEGLAPALRVSIVIGPPAEPEIMVTTDREAQAADGEQYGTGGGPSWDAYETGQPVAAVTLHADERWPALRRPVRSDADGVAAVPLVGVGAGPAGVLTVYGTAALAEDTQVSRAALFADAAATLQREHSAIAELRLQEAQLREALISRATIDLAKGILMARHGVDAEGAFAELVRRSQHRNVKLREVARQLVAEASSGASTRVRCPRPAPSAVS